MWENRLSGSEGGVALTRHPYPYRPERGFANRSAVACGTGSVPTYLRCGGLKSALGSLAAPPRREMLLR